MTGKLLSTQQEDNKNNKLHASMCNFANSTLQEAVLKSFLDDFPSELSTVKAELHKNCHGCMAGSMTCIKFKWMNRIKLSRLLEFVHNDLSGRKSTPSLSRSINMVVFTDDYSRYKFVYGMKKRMRLPRCF